MMRDGDRQRDRQREAHTAGKREKETEQTRKQTEQISGPVAYCEPSIAVLLRWPLLSPLAASPCVSVQPLALSAHLQQCCLHAAMPCVDI